MGDVLSYFEHEKDKHVKAAQAIIKQADDENRALTEGERALVTEHTNAAQDFAQKAQDARDNQELKENISRLGEQLASEPEAVPSSMAHTPGDAFVNSEGYKALMVAGMSGSWKTPTIEFMGAAGDPVLERTSNNDDVIFEQQIQGLKTPSLVQEVPSLAGLFAQGTATGGVIKYIIVTTRNAPADAAIIEAENKPGAEFAFDDATETLEKLAVFIPVSEEMLEDSPAVRDYINQQLPFMVRQAEDKKLAAEVYGAATGVGLSTDIGGTDANGFDAIAAGINDVQVSGQVDPDGLFIHPTDWWSMAVKKDSVAGQYYSGGPYASPSRNPWGVRVVISQRAPRGFPLVGNFAQGGQVWRKGGVRLQASNSHDDYFRKNLVAIRAEERVALTVYYPEFFSVVNLAS
jgi:HK97 family phage major capsid protein